MHISVVLIVTQIPQNVVGHLPGDAHQTAKDDVNGHIDATSGGVDHGASEGTATHGLMPRTVPMAFQDFTHCFVKPILDRRYFLQKNIVRRTEERICKSAKPLWFSSSEEEEEEEEGLDDTKNKQPQIFSEAHPQMLISQSSGGKHYRAKEKAVGHDHDVGSICSHSRRSRKSNPVTQENAGEEDAQEEPASYRGLSVSHQRVQATVLQYNILIGDGYTPSELKPDALSFTCLCRSVSQGHPPVFAFGI
uniref:uncharacterized protein LOC113198260 n=1 Tax=Urocitellus parryii TaxID=9999 RepID=UPI000E55F207|nr:uncharacterized protein LOC113198260 [Urocitellus parryii]